MTLGDKQGHNAMTDSLQRIQGRLDAEDSLLHQRTTIFLVTNGLLLAVLGLRDYTKFNILFLILGAFVSLIWLLAGWQSWRIIRQWHRERIRAFPDAIEVQVAGKALWRVRFLRPTDLLARWLPLAFFLIWLGGLTLRAFTP